MIRWSRKQISNLKQITRLAQAGNCLNAFDAIATQFKEVIMDADLLFVQYLLPNGDQLLFDLISGSEEFGPTTQFQSFGLRQCFSIDLAVRS